MSETAFDDLTGRAAASLYDWPEPQASAAAPAPTPRPGTPTLAGQIALADALAEPIAFLDSGWRIAAVNRAWLREAIAGGTCGLVPGDDYLDFLSVRSRAGVASATALIAALTRKEDGNPDDAGPLDWTDREITGRIYRIRVNAFPMEGERWHMIARYDVTELLKLRQRNRQLARRRLGAEEAERRRVARDLHDGTAQDLVALQLALVSLRRNAPAAVASDLAGIDEALRRVQREIRSLSLLYHPPLLDDIAALSSTAAG